MAALTVGEIYHFSYVGGRVYDCEECTGTGTFIATEGNSNIFHVKLPSVINDLTGYLVYTNLGKVKANATASSDEEKATAERIARYIKTYAYANQRPNPKGWYISPTVYISQTKIDSFLKQAEQTPVTTAE